jgi:hypothetical protein
MRQILTRADAILPNCAESRDTPPKNFPTRWTDGRAARTEQQASSLEETAAAIDEITSTVQRTAQNTNELASATTKTRQAAEHSGTVVQSAIAAMSQIEHSSGQIGQIIRRHQRHRFPDEPAGIERRCRSRTRR